MARKITFSIPDTGPKRTAVDAIVENLQARYGGISQFIVDAMLLKWNMDQTHRTSNRRAERVGPVAHIDVSKKSLQEFKHIQKFHKLHSLADAVEYNLQTSHSKEAFAIIAEPMMVNAAKVYLDHMTSGRNMEEAAAKLGMTESQLDSIVYELERRQQEVNDVLAHGRQTTFIQ